MNCEIAFTALKAEDHAEVAELIHSALVFWYESRLRQGSRFGDDPRPFRIFPKVYEALDPGEAITAREEGTGRLLGICFTHERETHLSLGIVVTAPEAAGGGIARRMAELAMEKARQLHKPVRLVSSLLNLDSFSLYNKLGFVPGAMYQDLAVTVPEAGLVDDLVETVTDEVREATFADVIEMADLEQQLVGIRRAKDYAFFVQNQVGSWKVWVAEQPRAEGGSRLRGFLVVSRDEAMPMLGPGVAENEEVAQCLLRHALDQERGRTLVFLLPCAAVNAVRRAYAWGARNVELHVAQSTQPIAPPVSSAIVFPTFLPESG